MAEPVLRALQVSKRFGGLLANDAIDLDILPCEIHALIGPNGAGKSTFVSLVSGQQPPTSGRFLLAGRDITGLAAWQRALAGIARSFQITSILPSFSVLENVAIAAQAHAGHSFRFWAPARQEAQLNAAALAALVEVGLAPRAAALAATLSHGEHRLLEIAMALAGQPRILLLDEPAAGMSAHESRALIGLFRRLRERCGILLIEHDMDIVFALADRVTVLAGGRVIASGPPRAIQADPAVRQAYLGEEAAPARPPAISDAALGRHQES